MASRKTPSKSRIKQHRRARRVFWITLGTLSLCTLTFPLWDRMAASGAAKVFSGIGNHYRVEHVDVMGAKLLPADSVLRVAGVKTGGSMFAVKIDQVEALLERHPWIEYATVRRRMPDTIELNVQERVPVGAVRGAKLAIVTSDGRVVAPMSQEWEWDLPILTPPRSVELKPGTVVKDSLVLRLVRETQRLRGISEPAWKNLSELYYRDGEICATLSQPAVEILLGRGGSDLAWVTALQFVARQPEAVKTANTVLDVRFPGKLVLVETPQGS